MLKQRLLSSIFIKLVLTFLLVLVPICVLGLYMYSWGLKTVRTEIVSSTAAQSTFFLNGLEEEFERIRTLLYNCVNNEDLQKLAIRYPIMNNYDILQSMLRLHTHMQSIKSSSIYLKDVSTHINRPLRTVSADRTFTIFSSDWYGRLNEAVKESRGSAFVFDERLLINAIRLGHSEPPLYMVLAEIDIDVLQNALSQFNTYPGSGSMLIGFPCDTITSSVGTPLSYDDISSAIESNTGFHTVNGINYMLISTVSEELGISLIRYIPSSEIFAPMQFLAVWLWIFTTVVLLVIAMYAYTTYRMIHKPLQRLTKFFKHVEEEDFSETIEIARYDEFGYLYQSFNNMLECLNNLINQNYKQQILTQKAQLKNLQSQINPHFLSNSLFIINTMARTNDENLLTFSKYLGAYFRFITRNAADIITLKEEIEHARTYAEIQQMRFSKRLTLSFEDLPERYNNINVPRLIVQPILENAFEYVVGKKSNDCFVGVSFESGDNSLKIVIEDNGDTITGKEIEELNRKIHSSDNGQEITGLININRRVGLYYGEGFDLSVTGGKSGGLRAELLIGIREV